MAELVDALVSNTSERKFVSVRSRLQVQSSSINDGLFIYVNSMYFVYAIKSLKKDWVYVGITDNLDRRLNQHNKGYNRSTKPYAPFAMVYSEEHPDRASARLREKYLKTASGKRWLKK